VILYLPHLLCEMTGGFVQLVVCKFSGEKLPDMGNYSFVLFPPLGAWSVLRDLGVSVVRLVLGVLGFVVEASPLLSWSLILGRSLICIGFYGGVF